MGEVADMMLDGTLCEMCGVFLNKIPPGYPCYCSEQCRKDRTPQNEPVVVKKNGIWTPNPKKVKTECKICKRWITLVGMSDHMRDKHPEIQS